MSVQDFASVVLNENVPEWVVYIQVVLFLAWFFVLAFIWAKQMLLKRNLLREDPSDFQTENESRWGMRVVISKHLDAMKTAGERGNELDIPLLIRNTVDQLNVSSSSLRSVLSLFLIFGLLGTLFGLAISLSQFADLLATKQLTNDLLERGLKELLGKLGGAFLPSIFGVTLTIFGVLLYSFFQRITSIPLANLTEHKTLTEWAPQLIKTHRQKEKESVGDLKDLIEQIVRLSQVNEDSVKNFKEVTETLKSEAGDLALNVKTAGKTLRILSESSQNLKDFSERFVESVGHITSFQEELKSIYEQNAADSAIFRETVKAILSDNNAFQAIVSVQFNSQSEETDKLFERLKLYEEGYLESRKSIDENLNLLLTTANSTYEKIGLQDEVMLAGIRTGLAEEVGTPIQLKLGESLKLVSEEVADKLADIGTKFGEITEQHILFVNKLGEVKTSIDAMNNPIAEAAADIKGIATDFDDRTQNLLIEIQREFIEENKTSKAQLEHLGGLNTNVSELANKFDGLGSKIDSFSNDAATLGRKLEEYATAPKEQPSPDPLPRKRVPPPPPPTLWERLRASIRRK